MNAKEKVGLLLRGLFRALPTGFVLVLLLNQVVFATISTVASGMYTPESISIAPSSYGSYGGNYFIPDAGSNTLTTSGSVWMIDKTTNSPSQFLTSADPYLAQHPLGGLFLPNTGWGNYSGQYLVSGYTSDPDGPHSYLTLYDSDKNATPILTDYHHLGGVSNLCDPVIYGDSLIVTDQQGYLLSVKYNAATGDFDATEFVNFVTGPAADYVNPFGITVASAGFGSVGGSLLVSEATTDATHPSGPRIVSVDSSGNIADFATINISGKTRLRQMEMAPEGFLSNLGINEQVLLVSATDSQYGGGLGTLLALNGEGSIVAYLKTGTDLLKFDPRGICITTDGNLLVSDASDPILFAQPDDFVKGDPTVVPEPSTLAAFGIGCISLLIRRRRSRK